MGCPLIFEQKSKAERAIDRARNHSRCFVVFDGMRCEVQHPVGRDLLYAIEEWGTDPDDMLGGYPPRGLSVWEGRMVGGNGSSWYNADGEDPELKGAYRAPTLDELQAFLAGRCPWPVDDEPCEGVDG